jgi:hypothetical protein
MCRSTNCQAEPEVWFRIVHIALHGQSGPDAYREQTVEIALGPKGAFENGNIGTLTRRVPANRVVSTVPASRGKSKPPKEPKTPKVVELLRKAIEWQALLESGEIANQAEIARREGITRARVTQVMGLLRLIPEIQERILSLHDTLQSPPITERMFRSIKTITDLDVQVQERPRPFPNGTIHPPRCLSGSSQGPRSGPSPERAPATGASGERRNLRSGWG